MSYPMWPSSLPQAPLVRRFSAGGEQPVIRQEMEAGLDRVTRISYNTIRNNQVSFLMDNDQLAEFWSFYENEANAGADLVYVPMVTGNVVLLHVARISSYPTPVPEGIDWIVSFSVETEEMQVRWE